MRCAAQMIASSWLQLLMYGAMAFAYSEENSSRLPTGLMIAGSVLAAAQFVAYARWLWCSDKKLILTRYWCAPLSSRSCSCNHGQNAAPSCCLSALPPRVHRSSHAPRTHVSAPSAVY